MLAKRNSVANRSHGLASSGLQHSTWHIFLHWSLDYVNCHKTGRTALQLYKPSNQPALLEFCCCNQHL